jgi:adenine-specific DNA-methyltransferase
MIDTAAARKARGAFFTPAALCEYVARWAVRSADEVVLEPSCGDAEFLLAANAQLRELGGVGHLRGAELHADSARHALGRLAGVGREDVAIDVGDFFRLTPTRDVTALVGNPPYVRYQTHAGEDRTASREAALRAGVALSGLASSWAAFTVHAAEFLAPGGRMGLVLPAELLSTNYASGVRRYLMERFASVGLIVFEERVFPAVQEEVVLLLADGFREGPTDHCVLRQVRTVDDLATGGVDTSWRPADPAGKWTASLLSPLSLDAYTTVMTSDRWTTLSTWGDTTLGAVTGNNKYFTMPTSRAATLGLTPRELLRISPPGSAHLRGLEFTTSALNQLDREGKATRLFRPAASPSTAGETYIAAGEATAVDQAYKCRVRSPWWRVPILKAPDLFLTYMNADSPRLCANRARVRHINSVHGVYLTDAHRTLGLDYLPLAAINSMTLLAAETVGRAYGGGMLKIEPREADVLPVPAPALVAEHTVELKQLAALVGPQLRGQALTDIAKLVDEILLVKGMGLKRTDVAALREQQAALHIRRQTRAKAAPSGD